MSILKKLLIFLGDVALLYGSLIIALLLRYGTNNFREPLNNHLLPFSLIFIIWLLIFYLSDLYREKSLSINLSAAQKFGFAVILGTIISIIFFYLFVPFFQLTPKTNLLVFALTFGILDFSWRLLISKIYISGGWRRRIFIIGESSNISETTDYLKKHPQIGFDIIYSNSHAPKIEEIKKIIQDLKIDTLVFQTSLKKDPEIIKTIYKLIALKINVIDFISFYETIFGKLPLEELEESWIIEKISAHRTFYETIKKIFDFVLSLLLLIVLFPFILIISIIIKLNSMGPIIYKQKRIGLNNKEFVLYKFRTMVHNQTNKQWDLWTKENDSRLTLAGRILRNTHLDEIPQLYNILKGDISFIGPRAERNELVELYSQLPYYDLRHIIKPGLTGWAQVNYKPSASVEEAKEKLKYDIYYIKNRSLPIDFIILIKTIRYLFFTLK